MANDIPITIARGDGIGPEIMAATLHILKAAGARLDMEEIEIGEEVYLRGNTAGIDPSAWESLHRTKVFLKAPITMPQGGGYKSLNVTTRKMLGLYANVRPCVVGTKEFAEAVAERMGQKPEKFQPVSYKSAPKQAFGTTASTHKGAKKDPVGVDVFLDGTAGTPNQLAECLQRLDGSGLKLTGISNRGVKVWPAGMKETFCSDHWRCRFQGDGIVKHEQIVSLLGRVVSAGLDFIKTENLCNFDGQRGCSLDQGE
jgi:hypothetical protein